MGNWGIMEAQICSNNDAMTSKYSFHDDHLENMFLTPSLRQNQYAPPLR